MNGRTIDQSKTPTERIAAAACNFVLRTKGPANFPPDYEDLRDWLIPYVEYEILKDRLARSQEQHASRRHGALMEEVQIVARLEEVTETIEKRR